MQSRGNLDRLEDWYNVTLKKFNKVKCKTLSLDWAIPQYHDRLEDGCIRSRHDEKEVGILVDEKLYAS